MITNLIKPRMERWYLIIRLEITVQSTAMDFWKLPFYTYFGKWFFGTFFLGSSFQNHSNWNITKTSVAFKPKQNSSHMSFLNLTTKLSFEFSFRMFISNVYHKKRRIFALHTVPLTIWHYLFLEFWLVDTWIFVHWRHQCAVTCLENLRQLNIRRGKKLAFQLSQKHPLNMKCPLDTGRKLDVLCTFNLRPVFTGWKYYIINSSNFWRDLRAVKRTQTFSWSFLI